jgi:hypothetical protein
MTQTPVYDHVAAYMEPLIKSSERIGSARALLMVSQWISQELDKGTIKPSADLKHILNALEKIREDILLRRNETIEWPTGTNQTPGEKPANKPRKSSNQSAKSAATTSRARTGPSTTSSPQD